MCFVYMCYKFVCLCMYVYTRIVGMDWVNSGVGCEFVLTKVVDVWILFLTTTKKYINKNKIKNNNNHPVVSQSITLSAISLEYVHPSNEYSYRSTCACISFSIRSEFFVYFLAAHKKRLRHLHKFYLLLILSLLLFTHSISTYHLASIESVISGWTWRCYEFCHKPHAMYYVEIFYFFYMSTLFLHKHFLGSLGFGDM